MGLLGSLGGGGSSGGGHGKLQSSASVGGMIGSSSSAALGVVDASNVSDPDVLFEAWAASESHAQWKLVAWVVQVGGC